MAELYPFFFQPVYKHYLWGGGQILKQFGRKEPPGIYAESWELSDRPEGMSIVTNGRFRGKSLQDIIASYAKDMFGQQKTRNPFPLLLKLIDANENLSIQVHPGDKDAKKLGGEAKTEAWLILNAEKDARVYAGFKRRYSQSEVEKKLATREILAMMQILPVTRGDVIFIPGGRLHAIGKGCLALEIQQNSNTTYRVYDWDRINSRGAARDLHLHLAKQVIKWDDVENPRQFPLLLEKTSTHTQWSLLKTSYFNIEKWVLHKPIHWQKKSGFDLLFFCSGRGMIHCASYSYPIDQGTTCLVPAHCPTVYLSLDRASEIFRFYIP